MILACYKKVDLNEKSKTNEILLKLIKAHKINCPPKVEE